jgi:hypothetical protein
MNISRVLVSTFWLLVLCFVVPSTALPISKFSNSQFVMAQGTLSGVAQQTNQVTGMVVKTSDAIGKFEVTYLAGTNTKDGKAYQEVYFTSLLEVFGNCELESARWSSSDDDWIKSIGEKVPAHQFKVTVIDPSMIHISYRAKSLEQFKKETIGNMTIDPSFGTEFDVTLSKVDQQGSISGMWNASGTLHYRITSFYGGPVDVNFQSAGCSICPKIHLDCDY